MKSKNSILYYSILWVFFLLFNISFVIIFKEHAQLTKYSIPAIILLIFHILYGFLAYAFRHKGNFIKFNVLFIRHFKFYLFEPDKEYTFTKKYKIQFYRMLAIYSIFIPFYIPFIFFTSSSAVMCFAIIVFLIPQIIFIIFELQSISQDVKRLKTKEQQLVEEQKEQERREEMGFWK